MLFVCLSHFASVYLAPWGNSGTSPFLRWSGWSAVLVSMIASPTFVAVSGIVVGYLYRVDPAGMPSLRRKLIDRGLFLLLIGHLLLSVPGYVQFRSLSVALGYAFITDVIAVAIIVGPTLLTRTTPARRVVIGAFLLGASWIVPAVWTPRTVVDAVIVRYAFGSSGANALAGFALLPWLGVYVLATVLGERVGRHAQAKDYHLIDRALLRVGAIAAALGAAITIIRHALRAYAPTLVNVNIGIGVFLAAGRKWPPGPVYLMLFGGVGIILLSRAFWIARDASWMRLTQPLGTMGRASFFVFVLQSYVYYLIIPVLALPFPQLWPLYYAATIAFLVGAATVWDAFDANRYLTVGLWRTVPLVRAVRARILTAFAVR